MLELNTIIEKINEEIRNELSDVTSSSFKDFGDDNLGDIIVNMVSELGLDYDELSEEEVDEINNSIEDYEEVKEELLSTWEEEYEDEKYNELADRLVNDLEYELKNGETFELRFNYTKEWSRLRVEVSIDIYNEDYEVIENLEDITNAKIGFSKTRNSFDEDKFKEIFESKI